MKRLVLSLVAVLPLTVTATACAQPVAQVPAPDSYAAAIDRLVSEKRFNGAVLVGIGDRIVFEGGFGIADADTKRPFTAKTPSRIASLTKQFTAATVLRLVEQGRLDLDTRVDDLLEWYPKGPGRKITVRQLLNHSSGLPRPERSAMREASATSAKARTMTFADMPLDFIPGTRHEYSNSGYIVLGAIIEAITGQSYEDTVAELTLVPAGLDHTRPLPDYLAREGLADDLARERDRLVDDDYRASDRGAPWAAGMMTSTVGDLFHWTRALHGGRVFASAKTLQTMLESPGGWEDNRAFDRWSYASGLFKARRDNGRSFVFHDGRLGSYLADLRYYPEKDLVIVVLETANGDVTATADLLEEVAFAK